MASATPAQMFHRCGYLVKSYVSFWQIIDTGVRFIVNKHHSTDAAALKKHHRSDVSHNTSPHRICASERCVCCRKRRRAAYPYAARHLLSLVTPNLPLSGRECSYRANVRRDTTRKVFNYRPNISINRNDYKPACASLRNLILTRCVCCDLPVVLAPRPS